jgi:hypothetical protein
MTAGDRSDPDMAACYRDLFVNRGAYTLQSRSPGVTGKHYYHRPDGKQSLSLETICQHLDGFVTIGLYAIDPRTQRSKWLAVDGDYRTAVPDLVKLRIAMREDGLDPALEHSRRGAHLWVFGGEPLPARHWRLYILNLAERLGVPVKCGEAEGIEVFPRHDELSLDKFGNAIRGPLGIHRATRRRYWFYDAPKTLAAQLDYVARRSRVSALALEQLIAGLKMPEQFKPKPDIVLPPYDPNRREFRILDHVRGRLKREGRDFRTRCPSCALRGEDKSGHRLAILIADPRVYRCWGGCKKEEIRAALGCPIRQRKAG